MKLLDVPVELTTRTQALGSYPRARLLNVAAGLLYTYVFRSVYHTYISVEWGYTGLVYRSLDLAEISFIYAMVAAVSWFIPTKLDKPSTVVIWFLYAIIFIPTISITFMIGYLSPIHYLLSLLSFSIGLILISLITDPKTVSQRPITLGLPPVFYNAVLIVFFASSLAIAYVFADVLQFANIDDVYVQRFAAADVTGGIMGYVRSYHSYLITPLMMAIGVCDRSRRVFALLSIAGFVLSYMVDASKISLVIPLVMVFSAFIFRYQFIRTYHMTGGLILLCMVSVLFTGSIRLVRFVADLILLRSIAIPGQTFAQYFDVFYFKGYTWWSNITGINAILPPPAAFQQDRFWPVLGQIVGAEYYGFDSRVNLNANPFVGEGLAAGGWLGIIGISLAVAAFLRTLDRMSAGWNLHILLVLMVPMGLTLTNVHLSTYLVSFGGAAWLLLFRFLRPERISGDRLEVPERNQDKWVSPTGGGR